MRKQKTISAEEIKRRTCQCKNPVFKYSKSSDFSVVCEKCFKPLKIREQLENIDEKPRKT